MTTQLKELQELEELSEKIYRALCDSLSTAVPNQKAKEYRAQQSIFFQANLVIAERFLKSKDEVNTLVIHCPSTEAMYEATAAATIGAAIMDMSKGELREIRLKDRFKYKDKNIWEVIYKSEIEKQDNKKIKIYKLQSGTMTTTEEEDRLLNTDIYKPTKAKTSRGKPSKRVPEWDKLMKAHLGGNYNLEPTNARNIVIGPMNLVERHGMQDYPLYWLEGAKDKPELENQILRRFGNIDDAQDYAEQEGINEALEWGIAFGPRIKQCIQNLKTIVINKNLKKCIIITDKWLDISKNKNTDFISWPPFFTGKSRNNKYSNINIEDVANYELTNILKEAYTLAVELDNDPLISIDIQRHIKYCVRELTDAVIPDIIKTNNDQDSQTYKTTSNTINKINKDLEERKLNIHQKEKIENILNAINKFGAIWKNGISKRRILNEKNNHTKFIFLSSRNNEMNNIIYNNQDNIKSIKNLTKGDETIIPTSVYLGKLYKAGDDLRNILSSSRNFIIPCYEWEKNELQDTLNKTIKIEMRQYVKLNSNKYLPLNIKITSDTTNSETPIYKNDISVNENWWEHIKSTEPRQEYYDNFESPKVELVFAEGNKQIFNEGKGVLITKNKEWVAAADVQINDEILYYNREGRIIEILPKEILPPTIEEIFSASKKWKTNIHTLLRTTNNDLKLLEHILKKIDPKFPNTTRIYAWLDPKDNTWFPAPNNLKTICKAYEEITQNYADLPNIEKAEKLYNNYSIVLGKRLSQEVIEWAISGNIGFLLSNINEINKTKLFKKGTVKSKKIM